ncbi:hypothetical protein [Corallococcus aberystwythensis]|uniref:Uncharacterized protein n=1 Tax=Corallococcus aberystwythensis TaxID=2316722 RepID=A0A3A8QX30_9BACT|nr:hypothetical protein [Corallococcus aberystwythensis]RKH69402.1 hypothetical protein D7W81_11060 [Corallococcus aberystwythensis]
MPLLFDRTTPIVDFGVTSSPIKWDTRKWFLWPAFAYKVLLPARGNPPFNVFQRATLDMCRAGVRDTEEVARRLALPMDLVGFILEQLLGMDALDDARAPTSRALRLMNEDDEPAEAEAAGYVIVDGHSLRIWPRVHRGSLPIVDADLEQGKARFQRGPEGRPETVSATLFWPTQGARPGAPTAYEVQKAARHHARRIRAFRRESSRVREGDDVLEGLKFKGLRVLGTDPEPIFVAAYLFLPKDARQRSWLVTDPCGLGVSDVLRPGVTKLAKEGKFNVAKLLEEVAGQAWHVDEGDLAVYFAEATKAARERVAQRLGEAAKLLPPEVLGRLADADVRLEGARTAKPIEDFLGNAYAALESVFGWLVSLYPDPSLFSALGHAAPENALLLQRIAERIGFNVSPGILPLLRVTRGIVKGAICFGNKTLPGRLAAALLEAQRNSNHPLATVATREPGALEFLAEMGKLRIAASHDTSSVPSAEAASEMRERLFALLRALVGVGPANVEAGNFEQSWGADLLLRVRARAEQVAEGYAGLAERPNVRTRVIEMHDASLLVKLLARSDATVPETLNTRLRDAVVAITIAMEAVFAEIERDVPTPASVTEAVSNDREQNAAQLAMAASALGFALEATGQLPKSLTHAKAHRIRRAAQGQGETLSARVAAQVLAAYQQSEHPLLEVAKRAPRLLLDVGRLVEARGHGDDVVVTAAEVAGLETMVANDVRAVLEAID